MNILGVSFSIEEIEEVDIYMELCDGMSVDGKSIDCFDILSNILHGQMDVTLLSRESLLKLYAQLKGYNEYSDGKVWFNNEALKLILEKFRMIINKLK